MRLYYLLSLVWLCAMPTVSSAQVIPNANAVEDYRSAELALLDGKPQQALRLFERSLNKQPGLSAARRGMALCYELLRDYPAAAEQYEAILNSDPLFSRTMYYQAGQAFYKMGEHEKALHYFRSFQDLQSLPVDTFSMNMERELKTDADYRTKVASNIRACEVSLDSVKFINITEVINLGSDINSKADDYFPFLTNDQNTLFFTRKTDNGDEDLYESTRYDEDSWDRATPLRPLNTNKDEGMSTMVRDGRLMFFTACGREGVMGSCDIWQAVFNEKGRPVEVKTIAGFANSEQWESQAAISCDGSTLYFASKREGGMGGTDLWVSQRQSDGQWSLPENLGPNINTELDEEAPFITNDGEVLYFSSTGHPGLGDQDIFMSWKEQGAWNLPINLGPPVNSPFRELGFFLTADGRTGYFASDRTEDAVGGLDIYKFKLNEQLHSQPITFVEGIVSDSLLDYPIAATVQIAGREDITTGPDGRFFLCVPAWDTLQIAVEKPYFYPFAAPFIIPQWTNRRDYTIEIRLLSSLATPVVEEPEPQDTLAAPPPPKSRRTSYTHTVFFEFDSSEMEPEQAESLLDFLGPLAGKKAERVDIIGFSDNIGTTPYNLRLSEDRAKAIAQIIQSNKMAVSHIYMEGRGEMAGNAPNAKKRKVEVRIMVIE